MFYSSFAYGSAVLEHLDSCPIAVNLNSMLIGNPLYELSHASTFVGIVAAASLLIMTGMGLPWQTAVLMISIPFGLFMLHVRYSVWRPDLRLNLMCGSLAIIFAASLAAATVAHVGMRLQMPLQDELFAGVDQWFGFNTPSMVLAFDDFPSTARVLSLFYHSTVPAVFLSAIYLSHTGQAQKVWELTLGYSSNIVLFSIISVIMPAKANFVNAGLVGEKISNLPAGSGIYHMASVHYFRYGDSAIVDIEKFSGVVTFPSFHTVMALIVAYSFRDNFLIRPIIYFWTFSVIVSTIPIGGHYVVDLAAGALFWVTILFYARNREKVFVSNKEHELKKAHSS